MYSRPAHHSNDAFRSLREKLASSKQEHVENLKAVADLTKAVTELQRNLKDTKLRLKEASKRCLVSERQNKIELESMRALKPRLCFWEPRGRLPEDLSIKILREAGIDARCQAVQVCHVFSDVIRSGRNRGAFDVKGGSLAAGEGHSVICTAEGRVLTFGDGSHGQLGHSGNADEMVPRMVEGLVGVKVAQVAAGYNHTVICTAEGRVLTFGDGRNGQLGHGRNAFERVPRMVEGLVGVKVAQIAAGYNHTVICTSEGRVWTFGDGGYGHLGHSGNAAEMVPRMVEGLVGVKVAQIAAGYSHTVICTSEGRVWTFGYGGYGQLGHSGIAAQMVPRMVEGLVGVKVAQVAAGRLHTVICTGEGRVWTFGHGSSGRLGHGGNAPEMVPRMVQGLVGVKVAQVAGGGYHTVICTAEGRVWTFGFGIFGQLGHGGNADEIVPRMVEGLVGVKVAQVAGGGNHTVICTSEGRVMGFGKDVDRSLWPKLVLEITDLGNNSEEDGGDHSESEYESDYESENEDEDESEVDGGIIL